MDRLGTKGGESALEKEIPLGRQGKVSWSQCSLAVCVVGQMADQLLPLNRRRTLLPWRSSCSRTKVCLRLRSNNAQGGLDLPLI
jgi:hypothetical protein